MEITDKQRTVLQRLVEFHDREGYMPSVREMQRAFGWRSHYSAQRFLDLFRARGWITDNHPRLWTLTPKGRRAAK